MGQIIFNGQKPKYCNLAAITNGSKKDVVIPSTEVWLIDSTNSSKPDGTGKYDYYIVGDNNSTASQLAQNKIRIDDNDVIVIDSAPISGSDHAVSSNGVYEALQNIDGAITSVNVAVDNTSGNPSGSAAISGSTLALSFSGLKGPKGDTGSQGPSGATGAKGDKGDPGDSGITGDVSDLVIKQTIDVEETYGNTDVAGATTVKTLTNEDISNEEVIAEALVEFASYFNDGYMFKGVLSPSDEIGDQINRVIYIGGKGEYSNLNDNITYVIPDGYIGIFAWNGTNWSLKTFSPYFADSSSTNRTLNYDGEHITLRNTASFIKHMDLGYIAGQSTYEGRQGCDCYNDLLFTFQKNNATCQVYSMLTKTKVADVIVTDLPTNIHSNTVCFGIEKYDSADTYPLLYVSGSNNLFVVRVQQNGSSFTMSVVQTIIYTTPYTSGGIANMSIDKANNCVWNIRYKVSWESGGTNDGLVYYKHRLPARSEGDITISENLDTFEMPWIFCQQGFKILNGRAFISYGNTTVMDSLQVVDLASHQQVAYIPLGEIAMSGVEIEDVFFYNNSIGLCYMNNVYLLNL